MPGDKSVAVRALPVFQNQTCWFLPHGNAGCAEGKADSHLRRDSTRLGACLQNKPRVPVASTKLPQRQVCGLPSSEPSLSTTTMRTAYYYYC